MWMQKSYFWLAFAIPVATKILFLIFHVRKNDAGRHERTNELYFMEDLLTSILIHSFDVLKFNVIEKIPWKHLRSMSIQLYT